VPFEIPDNLHPLCGPVAWLLGTWRGNGHGDYPEIDKFQFGQELIFTDEAGEKVRDAALETGFLRCQEDGKVEFLLSHNTGFVEIYYGTAEGGKLDLATDAVVRTETAKEYVGGTRLYGNVEGDLLYAFDMAAMGQPLQPHLWARLQRA
jgi:hypothetical protein